MWFTRYKIPKEIIDSRLFEFKGAVQTCNIDVIKFSFKVLTIDLGEEAKASNYYKEIDEFSESLTVGGSRRKILYYAFENLLSSLKFKKELKFNVLTKVPHGFSCPKNRDINNNEFQSYWENVSSLKYHLDEPEVIKRVQIFQNFLFEENYDRDYLNDITWHKSDLTSDIVSGSAFAGDSARLKQWQDFQESIMILNLGTKSIEQKNKALENFAMMLKSLPFNNY